MFRISVHAFRVSNVGFITDKLMDEYKPELGQNKKLAICVGRDLSNLDKAKKLLVQSASRILDRRRYLPGALGDSV